MIASLLHTNRYLPDPPSSSPPPPSFKPNIQLLPGKPKGKPKPRQVRLQVAFKNYPNAKSAVKDAPRLHQGNQKRIPSATLVVAPTSLLSQWEEELRRCSQEGTIDVNVWHGQNRFSLHEALYPDEVEHIDDDDEIKSHSDEDEDVVMVDETGSDVGGDDGDEWDPRAASKKVPKVKLKDKKKKIRVVVTSYGVLVSEHAKYEKSARKSGSSVFESPSTNLSVFGPLITVTSRMASRCSGRSPPLQVPIQQDRQGSLRVEVEKKMGGHGHADREPTRGFVLSPVCLLSSTHTEELIANTCCRRFLDFVPWSSYSFFRSYVQKNPTVNLPHNITMRKLGSSPYLS